MIQTDPGRPQQPFIWSLIRNIKGILALNDNRPIANPHSWMFG